MAKPRLIVLQLLPSLQSGGVEQGTVEIAAGLQQAGHRALVMSEGGPLVAELNAVGAEHLAWPVGRKSPLTLALVFKLRRLLKERQVDVLHVRSRVPAWLAWLAWRGLAESDRPRLVTTVHGFYSVSPYSAIMTRGERVICVSRSIRDYVLDNYPRVNPQQLSIIYRGVDRHRFPFGYLPSEDWTAKWSDQYPELRGKSLLLLPGRLTRLKGHHQFLRLLGALANQRRPVHGLIVGAEDPRRSAYAAELRRALAEPGLSDRVSLLGHRTDLRDIMAVSDLVLSLSAKPESFGRTTLEALSLGRPALGFAHGGVGEILANLYPAGAVPPHDFDTLVRTAGRLLDAAPRVMPSSSFSLEKMISTTLSVYEELAAS